MAECLGISYFLILGFIFQITINDVASERVDLTETLPSNIVQTWQSSTLDGQGANLAVDQDTSTCAVTEEQNDLRWRVDLGATHIITGIYIDAGSASVDYMNVLVSNNPEPHENELCHIHSPGSTESTANIMCYNPTKGRYVVLLSSYRSMFTLCDVKIYECSDGFYGSNCRNQCHCDATGPCDKETGICPGKCMAGYGGEFCETECIFGLFGPGCEHSCHCADAVDCGKASGKCPAECEVGYMGSSCQTQVPSIQYAPVALSKTKNSIVIRWLQWHGPVDQDLKIEYQVEFRKHDFSIDSNTWYVFSIVQHEGVDYITEDVSNLSISTHYKFRVLPFIVDSNGNRIQGNVSPSSTSYKTECSPPEPPEGVTAEPIDAKVDNSQHAKILVKWQRLVVAHQINCDGIKFYNIQYQKAGNAHWDTTLASNTDHTKNITGLAFETRYIIKVVAVNNQDFNGISRAVEVETSAPGMAPVHELVTTPTWIVTGVVITVLVILGALFGLLIYRRRKSKYYSVPVKDANGIDDLPHLNNLLKVEVNGDVTPNDLDDSGVVDGSASEATPSSVADMVDVDKTEEKPTMLEIPKDIQPIKVEELENYIMERRDNDDEGLWKEYAEIPTSFTAKYEVGRRNENKFKNRFVNIIAYDHSRVILTTNEGDPDSDYINANYIDGYNKKKAYIAAQGCNKFTLQDMWRTAWQENSLRIVMVTNLVENGKRKCDQYWPDMEEGEKCYGDIYVTPLEIEQTSDFVIRTFELNQRGVKRRLKQFHFVAWPDHGVPARANPIIAFRRKVRSYDVQYPGPLLVHCSAGVGRTGTFIALDVLLEKAATEGVVDIKGWTYQMRRDRVNMIQTVEQYIFVYHALLEALKAGDTVMPCSEFKEKYEEICKPDPEKEGVPKIEQQFQNLQTMSPKVRPEDCKSGQLPENENKNRFPNILPADRHRPYLMIRVDGTNDYINAVFLDGFKKRNAYIITQMPLPHTVIDFWRMVYEHKASSVIMLNPMDPEDETYGQYWMEEEGCECGPFVIEPLKNDTNNANITMREIKLTYEHEVSPVPPGQTPKEEKPRVIGQFQLNCWPKESPVPETKTALIQLIELVERWQIKTGDGPIIVHCHDGLSQSGLYTAVSCIWEKMKIDQEVDIFHAVKHLRYHRPQIVHSPEQYRFCYEMVLAYLAEFETYSNFR